MSSPSEEPAVRPIEELSGFRGANESENSSDSDDSITYIDTSDDVYSLARRDRPRFICEKYLLGDLIGEGTFGKVKEALDIRTLTRRAVKVFRVVQLRKKGMLDMVRLEIKLLQRLRHKNVVNIVDVLSNMSEETNSFHRKIWLVMEYCAGSLEEVLAESPSGKLPYWQVHHYFSQIIDGTEYLHGKGVVHKDIKPGNLLLNNDHVIKLTDFNASEMLDTYLSVDNCYHSPGTPLFQSPEVFRSLEGYFSGFKADVWSCGVTLYNLVTGKYPFSGKSIPELKHSIASQAFTVYPEISANPGLFRLLKGLLAKEPAFRHSIDRIRKDLWFQKRPKVTSDWVAIPPRGPHGDRYRSMTITPYLHEWHYPLGEKDRTVQVIETHLDIFNRNKKIPLIRGSRPKSRPRISANESTSVQHHFLRVEGFFKNNEEGITFQEQLSPQDQDRSLID